MTIINNFVILLFVYIFIKIATYANDPMFEC